MGCESVAGPRAKADQVKRGSQRCLDRPRKKGQRQPQRALPELGEKVTLKPCQTGLQRS